MPGPAPGTTGTGAEETFVTGVAQRTGLDPRVIQSWADLEGAYAQGGTGHFNYLNLRPYPGDPYTGVSSGNFEEFASVQDAIDATVRRLNQPFARPILQAAASPSATPKSEIAAIASTGWDASHYGGAPSAGGPNLLAEFSHLYGATPLQSPATSSGTGESPLSRAPIVSGPASAIGAVGSALSFPERAFKFLTSWRFVEILGGFLLLLVGLYLLGRQFGAPVPTPGFIAATGQKAQRQADSTLFQAPPGAGSDEHYSQNRATTGGGGARSERISSGPTPVYSGRARAGVGQTDEIPF